MRHAYDTIIGFVRWVTLPLVKSSQRTVKYSEKYKYFFWTVMAWQMKYVCKSQSNVSGTEPWTVHISEVVQGHGVRFVILGNLKPVKNTIRRGLR